MKPDKIYIVHYTKLRDRYLNLIPFLDKCEIPYEIITEYDKEDLSEDVLRQFYLANNEMFTNKIKPLWDPVAYQPRVLNLPEISCTIKHLTAIKKLATECTNFGLILEDDVLFDTNFNGLYKKYFHQTPANWDVIFLGEGCGVNFQNQKIMNSRKVNENLYLVDHPASNCAEAYLLKPQMARKIYESAIPFQLVSDWELAYQLYKFGATTYWWYPSVVTQGSKTGLYKSTLDLGQR